MILEANAAGELSKALIVVGIEGVVRVAVTGHGSKGLGVGSAEGKGYGIIIVFPCKRTGLRVLPEGDHMKAIFAPQGSGVLGGSPKPAGTLGCSRILY